MVAAEKRRQSLDVANIAQQTLEDLQLEMTKQNSELHFLENKNR